MKKNKLTIFLVAVILMLTVYYIKMPDGSETGGGGGSGPDIDVVQKHPEFATMREEIIRDRTDLLDQLALVLGSSSSSLSDKETALETMQAVSTLTQMELVFERTIGNLGFDDSLVVVGGGIVRIHILTETFTVDEFVEIAVMAQQKFGRALTVNIEIHRPSQL